MTSGLSSDGFEQFLVVLVVTETVIHLFSTSTTVSRIHLVTKYDSILEVVEFLLVLFSTKEVADVMTRFSLYLFDEDSDM